MRLRAQGVVGCAMVSVPDNDILVNDIFCNVWLYGALFVLKNVTGKECIKECILEPACIF